MKNLFKNLKYRKFFFCEKIFSKQFFKQYCQKMLKHHSQNISQKKITKKLKK